LNSKKRLENSIQYDYMTRSIESHDLKKKDTIAKHTTLKSSGKGVSSSTNIKVHRKQTPKRNRSSMLSNRATRQVKKQTTLDTSSITSGDPIPSLSKGKATMSKQKKEEADGS